MGKSLDFLPTVSSHASVSVEGYRTLFALPLRPCLFLGVSWKRQVPSPVDCGTDKPSAVRTNYALISEFLSTFFQASLIACRPRLLGVGVPI